MFVEVVGDIVEIMVLGYAVEQGDQYILVICHHYCFAIQFHIAWRLLVMLCVRLSIGDVPFITQTAAEDKGSVLPWDQPGRRYVLHQGVCLLIWVFEGGGFWQEAMVLCSRLQLAAPTEGGGGGYVRVPLVRFTSTEPTGGDSSLQTGYPLLPQLGRRCTGRGGGGGHTQNYSSVVVVGVVHQSCRAPRPVYGTASA